MSDYNIYCDESCHLQNDNSDTMFLGAISVEKSMVKQLSKGIRSIKQAHGLNQMCEIKWTKVSPSKFDLYKDLIDYFYKQEIRFRCVIAKGKDRLNNHAFNQSYDDWYY